MKIEIPHLKTSTPGNSRKHWRIEGRETKARRDCVYLVLMARRHGLPPFPVKVTLTRLSPRRADSHNLGGMLKSCVDGIADFYNVDDGDPRWQFVFAQEKAKTIGVRIEIEAKP